MRNQNLSLTEKLSVESDPNEVEGKIQRFMNKVPCKNSLSHQQIIKNQNNSGNFGMINNFEAKSNASSSNTSMSSQKEERVDLEKIKDATERRTYLCIKNLPCRYSRDEFKKEVDVKHANKYTSINYIPDKHDQSKKTVNRSYIFINFKHPLFVLDFVIDFHNRKWDNH